MKIQCFNFIHNIIKHDPELLPLFRHLAVFKLNDFDTVVGDEASKLLHLIDGNSDTCVIKDANSVLLDELDSLLEDVLHRLSCKNIVNISHHGPGGCGNHGNNVLFVDLGVDMDCY